MKHTKKGRVLSSARDNGPISLVRSTLFAALCGILTLIILFLLFAMLFVALSPSHAVVCTLVAIAMLISCFVVGLVASHSSAHHILAAALGGAVFFCLLWSLSLIYRALLSPDPIAMSSRSIYLRLSMLPVSLLGGITSPLFRRSKRRRRF